MRILKKTLLVLIALVALILIVLPYAAKYGAMYYLEKDMRIANTIDDVSINLLTGKVGLQGVHLYGEHSGELHLGELWVNVSLLALLQKNILVESVFFKDFTSNITELENAWNIGGIVIPLPQEEADAPASETEQTSSFDWGYGINAIDFSNINIDVSSQYTDSKFSLRKLKVDDVLSWHPDNPSALLLDISINDKSFRITGDAKPFTNEPTIKTNVVIDEIQLAPFLKSVKDLPFEQASVALFSDFELDLALKTGKIEIGVDGSYGLKNINLQDKTRNVKLEELSWNGQQQFVLPTSGTKVFNLNGLLKLANANIIDSENNIHATQEEILLNGNYLLEISEQDGSPSVSGTSEIKLGKLRVTSVDGNTTLASFDNLTTNKIVITSIEDVKVESSILNNLTLLKEKQNDKLPAVAKLNQLAVNNIHYRGDQVEVIKIQFDQLNADVRLDKQGQIPALAAFTKKQEAAPEGASTNEQAETTETAQTSADIDAANGNDVESKKFGIILDEIVIDKNSQILFTDNSVTPVYHTKLHNVTLSITNVDSTKPEKPTDIDFSMKIDEYGEFSLKGKANPFTEKANAQLVANLSALELVPLSSYAGKFAGINIKRGTMDINADINVKEDILDVKNIFHLNQLTVESDESEVSDNAFKDMPMPLDLTLDVLRDKNNVIELDIPVTGNINEPDFSLQDVYNTAMAKAMKFAATHYLTQMVQPLGLIITAGNLIGKAAAPKFDPLLFDNGSSEISDTNKSHIENLANILQEKDKLRFTICGTATESDWKAMQAKQQAEGEEKAKKAEAEKSDKAATDNSRTQQLLALANQRTKLVKQFFVEQHKIEPKRLFACNGKIIKDEESEEPAKPLVEITL